MNDLPIDVVEYPADKTDLLLTMHTVANDRPVALKPTIITRIGVFQSCRKFLMAYTDRMNLSETALQHLADQRHNLQIPFLTFLLLREMSLDQ